MAGIIDLRGNTNEAIGTFVQSAQGFRETAERIRSEKRRAQAAWTEDLAGRVGGWGNLIDAPGGQGKTIVGNYLLNVIGVPKKDLEATMLGLQEGRPMQEVLDYARQIQGIYSEEAPAVSRGGDQAPAAGAAGPSQWAVTGTPAPGAKAIVSITNPTFLKAMGATGTSADISVKNDVQLKNYHKGVSALGGAEGPPDLPVDVITAIENGELVTPEQQRRFDAWASKTGAVVRENQAGPPIRSTEPVRQLYGLIADDTLKAQIRAGKSYKWSDAGPVGQKLAKVGLSTDARKITPERAAELGFSSPEQAAFATVWATQNFINDAINDRVPTNQDEVRGRKIEQFQNYLDESVRASGGKPVELATVLKGLFTEIAPEQSAIAGVANPSAGQLKAAGAQWGNDLEKGIRRSFTQGALADMRRDGTFKQNVTDIIKAANAMKAADPEGYYAIFPRDLETNTGIAQKDLIKAQAAVMQAQIAGAKLAESIDPEEQKLALGIQVLTKYMENPNNEKNFNEQTQALMQDAFVRMMKGLGVLDPELTQKLQEKKVFFNLFSTGKYELSNIVPYTPEEPAAGAPRMGTAKEQRIMNNYFTAGR